MAEDVEETDNFNQINQNGLKIDIRMIFLTVKKKMLFLIIFPVFIVFVFALIAQIAIVTKWKVTTSVIAHDKNMSKTELPYMYQQLDFATVVPTILLRQNLIEIDKRLNLNLPPEKLIRLISISKDKTKIIKISVTHEDVSLAVNIANTAAEVFIDYYRNLTNSSGYKILDYYIKKKDQILQDISKYETASENFLKENKLISIEKELSMKYEQLNNFELELYQNKISVNDYQTKITDMDEKIAGMESEIQINYVVSSNFDKEVSLLENELASLREKYTDTNPKVLKIQDKIVKLKADQKSGSVKPIVDRITYGQNQLRETLIAERSKAESELKAVFKKISELELLNDSLKAQLNNLTLIDKNYFEIRRKLELNKQLLSDIESKISEAKIALDSNTNDFEIIERAYKPQYPESTGKKILAVVAGFLSFILALFLISAREFMDSRIKSEFDFKEIFNIKLLGILPDKNQVSSSVFFSSFQIFMGDLLQISGQSKNPIIAVAGDQKNIGKSFIIENAVRLLQNSNKRILYIDSVEKILPENNINLINDLFYGKLDAGITVEKHENFDKLYFLMDEKAFTTIIDAGHLKNFKDKLSDYDIIFWELFDIEYNPQLFMTIVSSLNLLIFVGRFRVSKRDIYRNIITFLSKKDIIHLAGVLNYVDEYYYKS